MRTQNADVVSDIVKVGVLLHDIADSAVFDGSSNIGSKVFGSDKKEKLIRYFEPRDLRRRGG